MSDYGNLDEMAGIFLHAAREKFGGEYKRMYEEATADYERRRDDAETYRANQYKAWVGRLGELEEKLKRTEAERDAALDAYRCLKAECTTKGTET